MSGNRGVVVQGLDLFDIIHFIDKKNKRFQAVMLADLEEILEKEKDDEHAEQYERVRKILLDGMNDYTRSVVRAIFGDIESVR